MNNKHQLTWRRAEIEADHSYARPHVELGTELHGGFDGDGNYLSPRTLNRIEAVANWRAQLEARGAKLIDANISLLKEESYPNPQQQKLLLRHGLGQTLFNSLTNIGRTEARGVVLAQLPVPDFQEIVEEEIGETTLGHLNKGLFTSHGWDEGGKPDSGKGGHDKMWFIARDLLWDPGTHPLPEPAAATSGAGTPQRRFPNLPEAHERVLNLMMDVLMIELKAYRSFAFNEDVMRDEALFTERRDKADRAAEIVGRIRMDEAVHVDYLQTALSEFRSFTILTTDGDRVRGEDLFDPVWEEVRHRSGVLQPRQQRAEMEPVMAERILREPNGRRILDEFQALATPLS